MVSLSLALLFGISVGSMADAPPRSDNLVVMLGARDLRGGQESQFCAAGIIVSQTPERTLILTANHVPSRIREAQEADPDTKLELTAEFAWLRGKLVTARPVAGVSSSAIDYALLSVDGADAPTVPDFDMFSVLGDLQDTGGRARPVIEVGNPSCRRWERAQTGQPVTSSGTLAIRAESRFAEEGSSGGALFTEDGVLVGMVVRSDGRFTTARPMPLLLEELARQNIRVTLTERALATERERSLPTPRGVPLASKFDRSAVRIELDGRTADGFSFRLDPSILTPGVKEVRLAGASNARLVRTNGISDVYTFPLTARQALTEKLSATYILEDDTVVRDVPLDVRRTIDPLIKAVAAAPEKWARCDPYSRECAFQLFGDAHILIQRIDLGFDPARLTFQMSPQRPPSLAERQTWLGQDDRLFLPSKYAFLAYRITWVDGTQSPMSEFSKFEPRCTTCVQDWIYEMRPETSGQPVISFSLHPVLNTKDASRDTLHWYPPPGLASYAAEVDSDGRGFLPLRAYETLNDPQKRIVFRFAAPDRTKLGPFAYGLDLDKPVMDRARALPIQIGCDFYWDEMKELCFVNDLPAFFFVKQLAVGTEPGRLATVLKPRLPPSTLLSREWRQQLKQCYGATYRAPCLALWRQAGAVFEISKTATDIYLQIDNGVQRSEVTRIRHTPRS